MNLYIGYFGEEEEEYRFSKCKIAVETGCFADSFNSISGAVALKSRGCNALATSASMKLPT